VGLYALKKKPVSLKGGLIRTEGGRHELVGREKMISGESSRMGTSDSGRGLGRLTSPWIGGTLGKSMVLPPQEDLSQRLYWGKGGEK